jgi:hypothetical protein
MAILPHSVVVGGPTGGVPMTVAMPSDQCHMVDNMKLQRSFSMHEEFHDSHSLNRMVMQQQQQQQQQHHSREASSVIHMAKVTQQQSISQYKFKSEA